MKSFTKGGIAGRAVRMVLVFGALLAPVRAGAQCTVGTLSQFSPPGGASSYGPSGKFRSGFLTSMDTFSYQGIPGLLVRENFGYTVYSLASPGAPGSPSFCDIEAVYHKPGDGFNTVFGVGASADGTRILVGYLAPHGNLLMGRSNGPPAGCTFGFAGEYPAARNMGEGIALQGSRYLGFSIAGAGTSGLYVSDVSSFLSGAAAQQPNSLAYEIVSGTPISSNPVAIAGNYAVYGTVNSVVVVDFSAVGPTGTISPGLGVHTFSLSQLGLPPGQVGGVAAAIHPTSHQLYLLVESVGTSGGTQYPIAYALASVNGGLASPVGTPFVPPSPWSGTPASSPGVATAAATSNDIAFFIWSQDPAAPRRNKLFTFSANSWGADRTPFAIYDSSNYPAGCASNPTICQFNSIAASRALFTGGSQLYLYVATAEAGYAIPVSCPSAGTPLSASANAVPSTVAVGTPVTFTGSAAGGAGGYTYSWTFGDGAGSSGASVQHAYGATGLYMATLTVSDSASAQATAQAFVSVVLTPIPLTAPSSLCPATTGAASVADAGPGATYQWSVTNGVIVSGQGSPNLVFGTGAPGVTGLDVIVQASSSTSEGAATVTVPPCLTATKYYTLLPCRLLDTRLPVGPLGGPVLAPGQSRTFQVTGSCSIPANAVSLAVNATATEPAAAGFLRVFAGNGVSPATSSVNFAAGQTRANNLVVQLSTDGLGTVRVENPGAGSTQVILDVFGYFAP